MFACILNCAPTDSFWMGGLFRREFFIFHYLKFVDSLTETEPSLRRLAVTSNGGLHRYEAPLPFPFYSDENFE